MRFDKLVKHALKGLDRQMGTGTRRRRSSSGTISGQRRTGNPGTGNRRGSRKPTSD